MTRRAFKLLSLLCLLLVAGCGQPDKPVIEQKPPAVAVVDWNVVWQSHALAKEWQGAKDARQAAERAFSLKETLLRSQQTFSGQLGQAYTAGQQGFFGAAFRTKVAELEAKQREAMLLWEHSEREKLEAAWRRESAGVEARHQPELVNLQLKLAILNLPKEDRQRLEAVHAQALQRRDQELAATRRKQEAQFSEKRAAENSRLSAQVRAESERLAQSLQAETQEKAVRDAAADQQVAAALARNQQELQDRIAELKQQETSLAERMENDIRSEAERMAVERRIGVVMRQVIVNVNAVDITQDMVKALQLRRQTKNISQ